MRKRFVMFLLLLMGFSSVNLLSAQDIYKDIPLPDAKRQFLYYSDIARMYEFESNTIFFADGELDPDMADAFFVFAENIGLTNGATAVNVQDYEKYSSALQGLDCPAISIDNIPAVVFVARNQEYCQVFSIDEPEILFEILFTIERNVECPTDLLWEGLITKIERDIIDVVEKWEVVNSFGGLIADLVDFVVEQIRGSCE